MSRKTNKAFQKRLKITKNNKVRSRRAGKNHFNAKESGEKKHKRDRDLNFKMKQKNKDRYLPHS